MKRWTTLLLLPVLLGACSQAPGSDTEPAAGTFEVAIGSGPRLDIASNAATRTALGDDGVTVQWNENDRLALWAVNSAAQTVLDNVPFKLYHYNASYNTASFRGSVTEMARETYTYYAVSPVPASASGMKASYEIPAVQDGAFHGEWDVMVASPVVEAQALRKRDQQDERGVSDNSDIVNLQFRHKVHVLKISIPKNDLGEPISQIELTFPREVTGQLSVDVTDPAAAMELGQGSNRLTLRFDTPKEAGDVVYAMIAPITLGEGESVSIVAAGESCESEVRSFAPLNADRSFAAGHTTPIAYNIPTAGRHFPRLTFHLAETGVNTLGEAINSFTVTAPAGWSFEDGSQSRTFQVTGTGDYPVYFREYTNPTGEQEGFQVTYDSDNAMLTREFTLPAVTVDGLTQINFSVPYLLEADFSQAADKSPANSTEELSSIGLPGWGGSRYGFESGRASFYMYVGTSTSSIDNRRGRIDTPFLPLKEGASVSVKVTYSIGAPVVSGTLSSKWNVICEFGAQDDTEGAISGDSGISRVVESYIPSEGGGFTGELPQTQSNVLVPDATSRTRLCWRAANYQKKSGSGWSVLTAKTFYVYLDDIRVSIAK
ncbi:fimbrillin family protein [uncultured Alistipes sp.]|uniref:fimbrillin family protein n=1 Tax=uncultured Alistipes sp. TaxID=538949 RepID=UPI002805F099|nr:fimbrillin family protein [uncultured Alistipes sp.]